MINLIREFGVQAVIGNRQLSYKELNQGDYCERLVRLFAERSQAPNAADWANHNPEKASILNKAMMIASDYE